MTTDRYYTFAEKVDERIVRIITTFREDDSPNSTVKTIYEHVIHEDKDYAQIARHVAKDLQKLKNREIPCVMDIFLDFPTKIDYGRVRSIPAILEKILRHVMAIDQADATDQQ